MHNLLKTKDYSWARENSDIDVALIIGNMADFFTTQMQLMRLRRQIDIRIEPHPIGEIDFNSNNPFAYEIQQNGIEIPLKNKPSQA